VKPIFEGIRVLDLGRFVAAPFAATLLADFGAEVIRVERSQGEEDRYVGLPIASGDTFTYLNIGRNKKAISLNFMTNKTALQILMELTGKSDVFLHNFSPGAVKRIGIDYEKIRTVNPRIIYAESSAFGSTGPYAERLGFDQIAQAISGAMEITGFEDSPPVREHVPYVDFSTAALTAFGIASALFQRTLTGKGMKVETSLLKTAVATNCMAISEYEVTGKKRTRIGNRSWYASPADTYRTKDGRWLYLSTVTKGLFLRWCRLIKREDLLDRPDLATEYDRFQHRDELDALVREWMAERSSEEAQSELRQARLPYCLVYDLPHVARDPQVISEEAMIDLDCGELGKLTLCGTPIRFSAAPKAIKLPPPRVGEHNKDIYCSLLGYSEEALVKLKEEGVI